jgi:hypothetical protein
MSESMSPPPQARFRIGVDLNPFDPFRGTPVPVPVDEYSRGRPTTSEARTGRPPTNPASMRRAGR